MTEDFLHYIWKFRLYDAFSLKTDEGQKIEVLHPGIHNKDAGPDFSHAKVRIGDQLWVGNVEIHVTHSDWDKHGHGSDPAYDNIILHVVYEKDINHLQNVNGSFPTLSLKGKFDEHRFWKFQQLLGAGNEFPCQYSISQVEPEVIANWWERNLVDRLEEKSQRVMETLHHCQGDWNEVMYRFLARALGLKINADPMWWLSGQMPLRILRRYADEPAKLEALLLGQSGLLFYNKNKPDQPDDFTMERRQTYLHLKRKHQLESMQPELWKFLRLRPPSFPTVRLAQLAALVARHHSPFDAFLHATTIKDAENLLQIIPSKYWQNHYVLGKPGKVSAKKLGKSTVKRLIVNAVIPVIFTYARLQDRLSISDRVLKWLEEIPAERNYITDGFAAAGVSRMNLGVSQAQVHVHKNYCSEKRCLQCAIGVKLMSESPKKVNSA
ncbi:MAG: DUF2851 family protein [Cryomorphaceae bacterium]|nr:DUF2851 family protein [Cryomorphaceae bacterium]